MQPPRVIVQGRDRYPVFLGSHLLELAGEIVDSVANGKQPIIIAAQGVAATHARTVRESFSTKPPLIEVSDLESDKSMATVDFLVASLLNHEARRDSVILAIGGGVVGDTAGFVASVFLRGVDLIHIPTTLLAQVDSSIGGKVAVNHKFGKNLIGSFHPPRAVIVDLQTLRTLPERDLRSGLFESLKCGVIGDRRLFELLESPSPLLALDEHALTEVIGRSIDLKGSIVGEDDRENDRRRLLNYGHTIGHGLEAAGSYERLTHGEAVGWGMIAANAIARERGILTIEEASRINGAIRRLLTSPIPRFDRDAVLEAVARDKKFQRGLRVMILARELGHCEIVEDIELAEIELGLDAILSN